jgi:hypothetical protein
VTTSDSASLETFPRNRWLCRLVSRFGALSPLGWNITRRQLCIGFKFQPINTLLSGQIPGLQSPDTSKARIGNIEFPWKTCNIFGCCRSWYHTKPTENRSHSDIHKKHLSKKKKKKERERTRESPHIHSKERTRTKHGPMQILYVKVPTRTQKKKRKKGKKGKKREKKEKIPPIHRLMPFSSQNPGGPALLAIPKRSHNKARIAVGIEPWRSSGL